MDVTPKLQKRTRSSLSLGNRLRQHRHSESPRNLVRKVGSNNNAPSASASPNILDVCLDTVSSTPPNRKVDFDDSFDYSSSPRVYDLCDSPTEYLSQASGPNVPDVVWSWTKFEENKQGSGKSANEISNSSVSDSGFNSAGSSSNVNEKTDVIRRTRSARLVYIARREEQRKACEAKSRRAERLRMQAIVQEKCEKLQKTLMEKLASSNERTDSLSPPKLEKIEVEDRGRIDLRSIKQSTSAMSNTPKGTETIGKAVSTAEDGCFDDFFNDTDTDCLLLEATQKLEEKRPLHSKGLPECLMKNNFQTDNVVPATSNLTIYNSGATLTPKSSTHHNKSKDKDKDKDKDKAKRSSLFMKFLEDDPTDNLFANLDENYLLQATQSTVKLRSPFQRCNSMPVATRTERKCAVKTHTVDSKDSSSNKIKRHASSHAISPSAPQNRGRQVKLKK